MSNVKEYVGKVIWFSAKKGFGFLAWDMDKVPQKDMFIYYSNIQMEGFKTIQPDQLVSFQIGETNKGLPQAVNVRIL